MQRRTLWSLWRQCCSLIKSFEKAHDPLKRRHTNNKHVLLGINGVCISSIQSRQTTWVVPVCYCIHLRPFSMNKYVIVLFLYFFLLCLWLPKSSGNKFVFIWTGTVEFNSKVSWIEMLMKMLIKHLLPSNALTKQIFSLDWWNKTNAQAKHFAYKSPLIKTIMLFFIEVLPVNWLQSMGSTCWIIQIFGVPFVWHQKSDKNHSKKEHIITRHYKRWNTMGTQNLFGCIGGVRLCVCVWVCAANACNFHP